MNKYPSLPLSIRRRIEKYMSRGTVKWDERKGSMTLYSGPRVPWVCHVRKGVNGPWRKKKIINIVSTMAAG